MPQLEINLNIYVCMYICKYIQKLPSPNVNRQMYFQWIGINAKKFLF